MEGWVLQIYIRNNVSFTGKIILSENKCNDDN